MNQFWEGFFEALLGKGWRKNRKNPVYLYSYLSGETGQSPTPPTKADCEAIKHGELSVYMFTKGQFQEFDPSEKDSWDDVEGYVIDAEYLYHRSPNAY